MIELTREEAILILKKLSRVDGYLLGISRSDVAANELEYPCELLAKKLSESDG